MKRSSYVALLGMGASALFLTACEDPNELVEVRVYSDVAACVADGVPEPRCTRAHAAAEAAYEAAYPRHETEDACEAVAGVGHCEPDFPASRNPSWRPTMIGFVLDSDRAEAQAVIPHAESPSGRSTAVGAAIVGAHTAAALASRALKAPTAADVARSPTVARGGFGGSASRVAGGSSHSVGG